MRRNTLLLLRCVRCRRAAPAPETDSPEVLFGPLRCPECGQTYSVAEGVPDLVLDDPPSSRAQRSMESRRVARTYERYSRDLFLAVLTRRHFDRGSEYTLYRGLLALATGAPLLDLGSGSGLFARRFAREPGAGPVIAVDVSKAMLEESLAAAREDGVQVDFARAAPPPLPLADGSVSGVLSALSLFFFDDLDTILAEIRRVLKPGGRLVASVLLPSPWIRIWLGKSARGYALRSEEQIRAALERAELKGYERVMLSPLMVFKAERPS